MSSSSTRALAAKYCEENSFRGLFSATDEQSLDAIRRFFPYFAFNQGLTNPSFWLGGKFDAQKWVNDDQSPVYPPVDPPTNGNNICLEAAVIGRDPVFKGADCEEAKRFVCEWSTTSTSNEMNDKKISNYFEFLQQQPQQ